MKKRIIAMLLVLVLMFSLMRPLRSVTTAL